MEVQNRLRELIARKERLDKRRYTQSDIAQATGITENTLRSWMNQNTTRFDAQIIIALCNWLDCSVGELLVIEGNDEEAGQIIAIAEPAA